MRITAGVAIGALVLATTTTFATAASAQAQAAAELVTTVSTATSEDEVLAALAEKTDVLTTSELVPLLSALPDEAITSSSGSPVDLSTSMGWRLDSGQTIVAFKLDDGGLNVSSLLFTFDESLDLQSTLETAAVLIGDSELQLQQWIDGELSSTESITAVGATANGPVIRSTVSTTAGVTATEVVPVRSTADAATSTSSRSTLMANKGSASLLSGRTATVEAKWHPFSLSRFNSCLSSAGVAWWIVAMVASVCFAAGVASAGLAFMACVVGTLGVGSGTTGYCFGYATYW